MDNVIYPLNNSEIRRL